MSRWTVNQNAIQQVDILEKKYEKGFFSTIGMDRVHTKKTHL